MAINKKELDRLSPQERIRRLKQLEEERKKEFDEIGELIKKSMQELKTDRLAEEITPEARAVDISRLFEKKESQSLERTARKEAPDSAARGYQALAQTYEAYTQLQKLDKALARYGSLTDEQKNLVGQIGERINLAEKYAPQGEKTANLLDASRATLHKLKKETGLE